VQNPKSLPTTLPAILTFQRGELFNRDPGENYAYSNFGYALLGLIIEVVTGKSYGQYVDEVVLNPVAANDTFLGGNSGSPGEARYYRPDSAMGRSVVAGPAPNPATVCDANQALLTPVPYNNFNILPMAAHGGWVASAPDLVKVLDGLDDNALLTTEAREAMWARPAGRSRRIIVNDGANGSFSDRTVAAFATTPERTFTPIDNVGDAILVGRGLNRWGTLTVDVATPGAGYNLAILYVGSGFIKALDGDNGLVDGTNGFSQDGNITFEAPLDWVPTALTVGDPEPRHYLLIVSTQKPTTPAVFNVLLPSGEADYGLGWTTSEKTIKLDYISGAPALAPGVIVRGSKSLAMAKVVSKTGDTAGVLTLNALVNGPFRAGELLTISSGNTITIVGVTSSRDRAATAGASHGGLLWGTRAWMVHRSDGVNWAVVFNQDNAYNPYWYLPGEGTRALSDAMDLLTKNGGWPP
jgi:CubicO group peptidase (beta-lactamase class C family)